MVAAAADFGVPLPSGGRTAAPMVAVVGNFDGLHLGHQRLLAVAREMAGQVTAQVLAVTFIPHPRTVVQAQGVVPLLTPPEYRRQLLFRYGANRMLVLPFNDHLRNLAPDEFLDRLRSRYQIRGLAAGPRMSIGRGRAGGLDFLRSYCSDAGIALRVVDPVKIAGEEVSSSRIRELLGSAELSAVGASLARPFAVWGEVEHGDSRGQQLGFPTANLRLPAAQALPPDGVYVMRAVFPDGGSLPAVGSIGTNPHFGPGDRKFEVHCLVPPGDLYGQALQVEILHRLRGQDVFASEGALVAQMRQDAERAGAHLRELGDPQ